MIRLLFVNAAKLYLPGDVLFDGHLFLNRNLYDFKAKLTKSRKYQQLNSILSSYFLFEMISKLTSTISTIYTHFIRRKIWGRSGRGWSRSRLRIIAGSRLLSSFIFWRQISRLVLSVYVFKANSKCTWIKSGNLSYSGNLCARKCTRKALPSTFLPSLLFSTSFLLLFSVPSDLSSVQALFYNHSITAKGGEDRDSISENFAQFDFKQRPHK